MFDFQSAISAAAAVVDKQSQQNSGGNYKYPLVYPQAGHTVVVKPLFNPKSGQILRLVNRHEKTPCYRTYGIDCPICSIQQQVKDMTGQDPFGRTKRSVSRGVCFAQYISSTYQIEKSNNQGVLQPGDIILFMFPWSVYSQINTIIQAVSQTPTGMDQAFCHAQSGMFIQVNVTADFKYTTTNVPYMTFPTRQTDDEFVKMLEDMDNLLDQVIPATITEEVDKQVKEYADAIYRQYVAPSVPNQAPSPAQVVSLSGPMASPQFTVTGAPQVSATSGSSYPNYPTTFTTPPVAPSYAPPQQQTPTTMTATASVPNTSSRPECFGRHAANSPMCICCPEEMTCITASETTK